eukprot:g7597.t1
MNVAGSSRMIAHILIVDDDPIQRRLLKNAVERHGYVAHLAENGRTALELLGRAGADIQAIVLDLMMPEMDGLSFLAALRGMGVATPVIVQTGQGSIESVVQAMRAGAFDFVVKPVSPERISLSIANALKLDQREVKARATRRKTGVVGFNDIVSASPDMLRVIDLAQRAAHSNIPVVLEGESGVGKEMIARAIQSGSDRAGKPFITVNCGAIPANLVESILFGHEKGAFTGAAERHTGKFVEADGGTLFLDEIGDLPLDVQVKLLRAVQQGEIETVGAGKVQKVNVRLISATNKDLIEEVRAGRFREDLYYRLNVFPITIPALRRRKEDIPHLARVFAERFSAEQKLPHSLGVSAGALALLTAYDWPGNIRQLENAIFRAVVLAEDEELTEKDFPQIAAQMPEFRTAELDAISVTFPDTPLPSAPIERSAPAAGFPYPTMPSPPSRPDPRALLAAAYPGPDNVIVSTDDSGEVRKLAEVEEELIRFALKFYRGQMSQAAAEDRTLKLYFVHTGEKAVITFKRNGRFDQRGLAQINQFLRDWRKNEPTKMDPRLFDLVWEVYRRSGAKDYIHVVSAYRSPATNGMLRTRSRNTGVAKNSQHMLGRAMDFYIPGVKLATLRALAMQMQVGGVGYYPTSGSPFVHLDVGGVRAWPRMSRQELVQIFPNGNTIHLPADGKPLPGYDQALADYKKRVGASSIEIASTAGGAPAERKRRSFLASLFGGGGADEAEDNEEVRTPVSASPRQQPVAPVAPASKPADAEDEAPAPVMVAAAEPQQPAAISAPVPLSRPAFRQDGPGGLATALYSPQRNAAQEALALQTAAAATDNKQPGESFADLSNYSVPVPTLLGPRGLKGDADTAGTMTASLAPLPGTPELTASVPLPAHRPATVQVASVAAKPPAEDAQRLTPELVAALARSVPEAQTPADKTASGVRPGAAAVPPVPAPSAPVSAQRPTEMAALPKKVIQASPRPRDFGDGFDAPKPVAASAGAAPSKGGRASRPSAAPASANLTGDVLAKWALSNSRAGDVTSMKAPRVVTRTLNSDYSAAYASDGFKPVTSAVAIDPNRFSGGLN